MVHENSQLKQTRLVITAEHIFHSVWSFIFHTNLYYN